MLYTFQLTLRVSCSRLSDHDNVLTVRNLGIYQSVQNVARTHLAKGCSSIPSVVQSEILVEQQRRIMGRAGKDFWMNSARDVGLIERDNGLWFEATERNEGGGKSPDQQQALEKQPQEKSNEDQNLD